MGQSFQDLLNEFVNAREMACLARNDPDRNSARLDNIEYTVQTILEKLRDKFD